MLTEGCPNRCEYCYIKNRSNPASMTIEMIDSIMEKHKPYRIIFFGGEPILQMDLIEYTMRKYYGKCKFQIVTSTMGDFKRLVDFDYKGCMFNEMQISWDGFNRNRINQNDENISLAVWKNIQYGISRGIEFDVKCVISNDNVKDLREIHDTFKDLSKKGVSGQIVIAHRPLYTEEFYTELKKNLPYTFDLDKMYSDNLNKILAYIRKDRNFSSCDAGNYVVIDPYGRESYCTALSQEKDKEFTVEDLKTSIPEDCKKCEYNYMCDGGCRYERYLAYGDEWRTKYLDSTCRVTKIYYNTIKTFLNNLSLQEKIKFLEIAMRYNDHLRRYYC